MDESGSWMNNHLIMEMILMPASGLSQAIHNSLDSSGLCRAEVM